MKIIYSVIQIIAHNGKNTSSVRLEEKKQGLSVHVTGITLQVLTGIH